MIIELTHPQIIHLPIALSVLMPLVAGGIALAWWRGWLPSRAWFIVALFQLLLVGSGIAALQSGEDDEEVAERVVAERFINAHEEAADRFMIAAGVLAAIMLLPLLPVGRRWHLPVAGASVAGTVFVLSLGYQTGKAGGELVYTHGAAQAFVEAAPRSELARPASEKEDDDDDD